mgnify:FL=1
MPVCLGITSGKGGTGKSTVAAGLAAAFSKKGRKTVLIDMDQGMRCQDLLFGFDEDVIFDLSDILSGKGLSDCIYSPEKHKNLYVIPAPAELENISLNALCSLTEKLKSEFDAIIFDFPAGTDFSLYSALGDDGMFITVCNPDLISVRDAQAVSKLLPKTVFEPRLIINKFDKKSFLLGGYKNFDQVINGASIRLIGVIPYDKGLSSLCITHCVNLKKRAGKAFLRTAERISGKEVSMPDKI